MKLPNIKEIMLLINIKDYMFEFFIYYYVVLVNLNDIFIENVYKNLPFSLTDLCQGKKFCYSKTFITYHKKN